MILLRDNLTNAWRISRALTVLIAVAVIMVASQPVAFAKGGDIKPPKAPKSSIVVADDFKGSNGALASHDLKTDLVGAGWQSVRGNWQIDGGATFDTLGYSTPYITAINPSASNYKVSIDITWFGSSEAGLVFRHEDNQNYYSVVYTGNNLELRKTIADVTTKIDDKKIKWKRFDTKTIEVTVNGPEITVKIGSVKKQTGPTKAKLGKVVIAANDTDLEFSRSVGAIIQRTESDQFEKIEVRSLGPEVSPLPIEFPAIGDSILIDNFDDLLAPLPLSAHIPDFPGPTAIWTQHAGLWNVSDGVVNGETGGNNGDLRATIDTEIADADIYATITRNSGLAGIVYRSTDNSNWWMTWFDHQSIITASFSPAGFRVWDETPFVWGDPGTSHTLRVRLNGHGIRIYVDHGDLPKTVIVSDVLEGSTRVGFFNRFSNDNTFDAFAVAQSPALPTPDVLPEPYVEPDSAVPPATPPGLKLFDSFSDRPTIWNAIHDPDLAPEFRGWRVENGVWVTDFDQLTELTGAQSDQRVVVDTGVEDSLISTKFEWNSGRVGITFRYRDERNWAMVWYDGFGDLVFGKVAQGRYSEIGRFPVKLKPGKSVELDVWTEDDTANVRFDRKYVGSFDVSELPNSTFVGLFSRNLPAARFDNLALSASTAQPNPGGLSFATAVSDMFQETAQISLDSPLHQPDIHPLGAAWADYAGGWKIENGAVHESFGFNSDLRAAIPGVTGDQRVSADIEYNGGLAGLTFRYRNEQNWYMLWYDGRDLILGRNVNGSFSIINRLQVNWGPVGTVRNLSVLIVEDRMTGFIDGVDLIDVYGESSLNDQTRAGFFARSVPVTTTFDNFKIDSVSN